MSTTATAPAFLMRHKRKGKWFTRRTYDFTATYECEASPVGSDKAGKTILAHADGMIEVVPVDGKPLIR